MKQRSFNVLGNIAIVNFSEDEKNSVKEKKKFAEEILKSHKSIRVVLEKSGKFKGRLRKMQTSWLAGEKAKEVLYKENGCVFRFNIDKTYFSPRLSGDRKEIAEKIKKKEKVLVIGAGVAPYPIIISKISGAEVWSNEINREANKYALDNIVRNKLQKKVFLIPGDIKKVALKLAEEKKLFDVIVMTRPNLKDTFLKEALMLCKKNTRIFYHAFCKTDEINDYIKDMKKEVTQHKRAMKLVGVKKIGDIAPYKFRFRVEFLIGKK